MDTTLFFFHVSFSLVFLFFSVAVKTKTNKKTGFKSSQQRDFEQLLSVKWGNIFQRDG